MAEAFCHGATIAGGAYAQRSIVLQAFGGTMDFLVAGIISVALLVYLGYALFYPERF